MTTESTGTIQSGAKPDGVVADILLGGSKLAAELNDDQEKETVKEVMGLLQKAKNWKGQWSKDHDRWWNYWESNHYKGRVVKTITQAIINTVWSSVETFVGHVVDVLPDPLARARRAETIQKAKVASKWLLYEAQSNDIESEVQHPVREACVVGAGWFKVGWDWMKMNRRGDVDIVPKDGKFIFPSPHARNVKELRYIIEAQNVPRDFVIETWPEKGPMVPPGTMDGSLSNIRQYSEPPSAQSAPQAALLTTTTGSDSRWVGSSNLTGKKQSDLVTLIEAWIRQKDGSMRLVVIANNVLLQDGPSPYDDDDFPYAVVNILPTMDTIQGRGLVQFVEGLQDILNQTMSNLLDQQRFAADPMLGVASLNLEESQGLENSPGSVLFDAHLSANGTPGYYWLQAPGFNQAWMAIQEVTREYMDSVLGRVDVLKGERPAGVNTLGGLEIVRDEANVRIRSLIRWVKASLKRVYKLVLSRLRQFAKDERQFRIVGANGEEEFVTVNPSTGTTLEGAILTDFTLPDDVEFDVEFGEDLPGGHQAEIELALSLATTPAEDGMPMVDRQYVLEKALKNEAPEVLERMAALAASQAEAAQKEAAAGSGEGAPSSAPPQDDDMDAVMAMFGGMAA